MPDDVRTAMVSLPDNIDFNLHVKPILSDRCFSCHGPDPNKRKAGLRLDQAESAYAELTEHPGYFAVKPGKTGHSQLVRRILTEDPELMMPPPESDLWLSSAEKATLIRWIEQGAEYKPLWSLIPPERPKLPEVSHKTWPKNGIDYFILQKNELQSRQQAEEADKETLLRRVSLDLTGLPPTLEEIDDFLADTGTNAYEKAVDRLLASPHYGERMATDWMDLARFADTHGYTVDRYRDMSPWRDWVIRSFNENMPYDRFVTWQLAGDLLPDATRDQILATGFNRNHQQNMEGGIVEEEFRVEYVADRTNTLGTAFMGITLECARCHDHKFDPVSQKDYYQLFSFFNNVKEAGQISWDDALPAPTLLLTDGKVDSIARFLDRQIAAAENRIEQARNDLEPAFETWLANQRTALKTTPYPAGLIGRFDLNSPQIANRLNPRQKGEMRQQDVNAFIAPVLVPGKYGKGLLMDGDAWLDLGGVGAFERDAPFTVGIWVNLPDSLHNGVIFHQGIGAALYNFRGFHLAVKNDRLEMLMAHLAPYNAVIEYAENPPRDQWIHLAMTYDGSSTAAGLKVYLNGVELPTKMDNDLLYKSIQFHFGGQPEPGIQIGARWRGIGIKDAVVDEIAVFDRELAAAEVLQLFDPGALQNLLNKPAEHLSAEDKTLLKTWYSAHAAPGQTQMQKDLQNLRRRRNETTDTVRQIMVMAEMPAPRQAHILVRGQYDVYGDPVSADTPEKILPMPAGLPKNRLGLAEWLFLPDHPLTARVAVNRLWQQFFGTGLVRTSEDFGNQGEMPSHPELLDWLAVEFRESGWDVKQMAKLMVMSATYRQSSRTTPEIAAEDPKNRLLARGPSNRLTAEMLRDNALAASGLLVNKIGGPSVKPYQPPGLWKINGAAYQQDTGENLYRRSLYTIWKRTVPYPTQATFDAPTRDRCTVRRQKTSTPLQALVLMNDPVYGETARVMGGAISQAETVEAGIRTAFRKLTGRQPAPEEMQVLADLQRTEYQKFSAHPEKIKGWLGLGESVINPAMEPALAAANTVVASTILNADAVVVKR